MPENSDAPRSNASASLLSLVALISTLLLVPCFWRSHIQAGDVASHVYNAWLAQLVSEGKAPGVYVVWQFKNVLFDLLLASSSRLVGFLWAERISVSICVLAFFWGVFCFVSTVSRRPAWFLTPGIAMLAYGYVFHMGFMNYYLSIGLACFGLAAMWDDHKMGIVIALLVAPLALLAHPLGFLWLLGTGVYRLLWPRMKGYSEWLPPVAALSVGLLARWVLKTHVEFQADWPEPPFYKWNGLDQFWVFGPEARYFSLALLLFIVGATLFDLLTRKEGQRVAKERRLEIELYLVAFFMTALLPENLRPDPQAGWIGLLVSRLTLICAIFIFCWLGTLQPRRAHLLILGAIAAVFFVFVYRGTAFSSRLEANAEKITRELPFGTRVAATVFEPADVRDGTLHVVDRACIGHCFLFSNYEASTRQFRVRAQQGSPVVSASVEQSEDMQFGNYQMEEEDLPLKEIYQCNAADLTQLCIRDLNEGEENGTGSYRPQ